MIKYIRNKIYIINLVRAIRKEQWLCEIDAAHQSQGILDITEQLEKVQADLAKDKARHDELLNEHKFELRKERDELVKTMAEKHKELAKIEQMLSTLKKNVDTKLNNAGYLGNRIAFIKKHFLWVL